MRKGMIRCLTFKLLFSILYFMHVTIKESVWKKWQNMIFAITKCGLGMSTQLTKTTPKSVYRGGGMEWGRIWAILVQNCNIFLYRSTHFTFCLNFPISAWNIFLGLSRLSYVVSPFWDDTVYLKSNLKFISITFAANVYRLISQNLHRL